ncbi:MAG: NAD(P)H-dependent oxidoreductase [Planctomycetota bacterium]
MYLVLSASLNPTSRSRLLGKACHDRLETDGQQVSWFDLAEHSLPLCDGASAYADPKVAQLGELLDDADAVFIASPVYNFDVNAALKNAVELTGKKWTGKVVAMMLAAGGAPSYMSAMGFANSLMLDFRCLIIPRFVYATGESFEGQSLADEDIESRMDQLVLETLAVAKALKDAS